MNKKLLLFGILLVLPICGMSERMRALRSGRALTEAAARSTVFRTSSQAIMHDGQDFHVCQDGRFKCVQRHDVDKVVRNITTAQARAFKECGYLRASKAGTDYVIYADARGKGGLAGAAWQSYWATKIGLYSLLGFTVGGAALLTGGAAVAAGSSIAAGTATTGGMAFGAGNAVASAAIATVAASSQTAAFLTTATGSVAAVVGGTETGLAASAAALGTSAVASVSAAAGSTAASTGICAFLAAGIESISVTVGCFFLVCPWTPW